MYTAYCPDGMGQHVQGGLWSIQMQRTSDVWGRGLWCTVCGVQLWTRVSCSLSSAVSLDTFDTLSLSSPLPLPLSSLFIPLSLPLSLHTLSPLLPPSLPLFIPLSPPPSLPFFIPFSLHSSLLPSFAPPSPPSHLSLPPLPPSLLSLPHQWSISRGTAIHHRL